MSSIPLSEIEKAKATIAASRRGRVALARQDINTFIEYVFRDEETGRPVLQAPVHEAWHRLATEHDRLLIWSAIEHGKTGQLAIYRTLFALGQDPSLRVAIVSNTHTQAVKIMSKLTHYVASSNELREVFPHLKPGRPWTARAFSVERPVAAKDPSVQAFGVHGNVLGARLDLIILDDILDPENTRTPQGRQDLWDWYHATLAGRLTRRGRVVCIGTAFHPEDFLHRIAVQPGWKAFRYPVVDENGEPRWPERWPLERVLKKRAELGPLEFARQMLCLARDDNESFFKQEWINAALARGDGRRMAEVGLQTVPRGCHVVTGVDLAVQKHAAADLTVFFTIIVHPDGTREVLCIEAGRWIGPEIVDKILDINRRYLPSVIVVENNAAQDYILQFVRNRSAAPIVPFTTGKNKLDVAFGVPSIGTEMANGKWVIPNEGGTCHREVDAWIREMLYFDPRAHTGDRLMASWFAREGVRLTDMRVETGRVDLMRR
jgi:hypothetical protein